MLESVLIEREQTCPDCHTRDDEWGSWQIDNEGRRVFVPFDKPPYEARTHIDLGCAAIEQRMAKYKGQTPPGVKVRLERPAPKRLADGQV